VENGDVTDWVAAIGTDIEDNRPAEIHARAEDIRSRPQVTIGGDRIISLGFALNTQAVYIESEKGRTRVDDHRSCVRSPSPFSASSLLHVRPSVKESGPIALAVLATVLIFEDNVQGVL
jgi:hypothetical protein